MEVIGSLYVGASDDFFNGIYPIFRCVKAEKHDLGVVMVDVKQIGNIVEERNFSNPQTGRIYDVGGCSPTLSTMQGGNQEPKILVKDEKVNCGLCGHFMQDDCNLCGCNRYDGPAEPRIVAMRGRNPDNPSDRTAGALTRQRLELNNNGTSNTLTSVQKDNLVLENPQYRIRKLTPRECGRLMDVTDEDITKMEKVNSNSQLYKQFGNSIVVDVMCAMFWNLNINQ